MEDLIITVKGEERRKVECGWINRVVIDVD